MAHTHILPKARWQATAAISACSLLISSVVAFSGPPQWWFERGVIDENAQEENYSAVNAGQAKWMATQAHAELSERLAPFGGVDFELEDVFPEVPANPDAEWYEKQKAPLNLGQLKAISKPFYDNLNRVSPGFLNFQAGINGVPWQQGQTYPWNPNTPIEENLALANIGQLKSTFAFQFGVDSDSDGIADFWEFGATAQASGGVEEGLAALGGNGANSDGDYLSDTEEFALGTDPFDANSVAGIEWADSRNVEIARTLEGSTIHKSIRGNQWNAAAVTALAMQADGSVSFEFSITGVSAMVGFNYANTNWAHTDIAHAFFLGSNSLHIRENNRNIHTHGNYTLGDQLKITREGEQIRYFVNDVLIYTSELASPRPVFAKVVAHHQFAGVEKLQIEGFSDLDTDRDGLIDSWEIAEIIEADTTDNYRTLADVDPLGDIDQDGLSNLTEHYNNSDPINTPHQGWLELQWQDLRNTIAENPSDQFGSSLTKSAVGNGYNADGNSTRTITGDGGISFRAGRDFTRILCGLDSGDGSADSASFRDIDFCIYVAPNGIFYVYESGRSVRSFGHYGTGDSFLVERDGNSIVYKKNGEEFYRSTKESTGELIADCSIHVQDHSLVNTLIRGVTDSRDIDGDGIAYNVEYEALSKLPRTAAQSIADITAEGDIDGDGLTNILEVTNGTDLTNIYTEGGNVDWPTDAIVAWYRTDGENAVIADSNGNLTSWPNFAGENYDIIPTVTTAGRAPTVTPAQGAAFTNFHAAANQPTHIDQQNTDLLNAAEDGFTILTAFTPTEDPLNSQHGLLNNERFRHNGFRFGVERLEKFQWWSGQSGGTLNISSRKAVQYGTNYQITLRHTAETLSSLHLNGSLEAVAQQAVIHPNTNNIRLNFIGGHVGQPTDWHELIIANRALSYGEQTLLEDYLAAKHRGEGPLAEDMNGNGIEDWQDIEKGGTAAMSVSAEPDSDNDGLPDSFENLLILFVDEYNSFEDVTPDGDGDGDGVSNIEEFRNGLLAYEFDSDGDGYSDRLSVELNLQYRFEAGQSVEIEDSSGNGNDGDGELIQITEQGIEGVAAVFDQTESVIVQTGESVPITDDFSISLWVKTDEVKSNATLWSGVTDSGEESISLSIENESTLSVNLANGGSHSWDVAYDLTDDLWHLVVLTKDNEENEISLYIDGQLINKQVINQSQFLATDSYVFGQSLLSGGSYNAADRYRGLLDEVRIHEFALDEDLVTELFQANDRDGDRISDDFEIQLTGNLAAIDGIDSDFDLDGINDFQERIEGTLGTSFETDNTTEVILVSGEEQEVQSGDVIENPLVFELVRNGEKVANAPVQLRALGGLGRLFIPEPGSDLELGMGTLADQVEMRTDDNGRVSIYFRAD